ALILEVEALANGETQALAAGSLVEEARGERQRQLVGVADAIASDVAVVGEELREIEVVERGVEYRGVVLPPVGNVDVVGTRLERLRERGAADFEVTLEVQSRVDAGDRNRVARV